MTANKVKLMKKLTSFALMTASVVALSGCVTEVPVAQAPPPPAPVVVDTTGGLSPACGEVLRLSQAGTSQDVILAYVQNASGPFYVGADQIVYLQNNGVSQGVITAMLNHDQALRAQGVPVTAPVVAAPPVATPPPVYVSSPPPDVAYFYDDLKPYGAWIQADGIGWCWQPTVVVSSPAWRPYCDAGHWVYTDAGWYWQSDYSWGWAPFHYGRWQQSDRCGWVWVPDRVWGPSWVVWRTQGDYCGWAPLPPHADFDAHLGWRFNGVSVAVNFDFGLHPDHFTFVNYSDFNAHDLGHRRLDQPQVTKIYNNTTIINNYVVNNNTVINQGVRVDRVAQATHTNIRQVTIRDVPASTAAASHSQAAGTEVAYRAQLKAPARPTTEMVAQTVDDRHPVVAHSTAASVPSRQVHTAPQSNPATQASAPGRPYQPATGTSVAATTHPAPQPVTRPTPSTGAAPTAPVAHATTQPKPPTRTTTAFLPAPKPAPTVPKVAMNEPGSAPGGINSQLHPLRMGAQTPSPGAEPPNPHVYQPKSARQAAETHALPNGNSRQAPNAHAANAGKGQQKNAE